MVSTSLRGWLEEYAKTGQWKSVRSHAPEDHVSNLDLSALDAVYISEAFRLTANTPEDLVTACEWALKALSLSKTETDEAVAHLQAAAVYLQMLDWRKALQHLDSVNNPGAYAWHLYQNKGYALRFAGRLDDACSMFDKAIALAPSDKKRQASVLAKMEVYIDAKKYGQAVQELKDLQPRQEFAGWWHLNTAEAVLGLRDTTTAIRHAAAAIWYLNRLDANSGLPLPWLKARAFLVLLKAYGASGDRERAKHAYSMLLTIQPCPAPILDEATLVALEYHLEEAAKCGM